MRNFRVVLHGLVYRGGANNLYHRTHPRKNENPLPADGLRNLCEEGFGIGVYLYSTNYSQAPHEIGCDSIRMQGSQLRYLQKSPFADRAVREILKMVYDNISTYQFGPMYVHCWNGWHASGLISAYILRQFCDLSPSEAVEYWNRNTDGTATSQYYDRIRKAIRYFKPFAEFKISDQVKNLICPQF